jgi:hypothetical protein
MNVITKDGGRKTSRAFSISCITGSEAYETQHVAIMFPIHRLTGEEQFVISMGGLHSVFHDVPVWAK